MSNRILVVAVSATAMFGACCLVGCKAKAPEEEPAEAPVVETVEEAAEEAPAEAVTPEPASEEPGLADNAIRIRRLITAGHG